MLDNLAAPVQRALTENSQRSDYANGFVVRDTEPGTAIRLLDGTSATAEDGVFNSARSWATYGPPQILVMPFCSGSPGSQFRMKIWGWYNIGSTVPSGQTVDPLTRWLPLPIAEFLCVAGSQCGLGGGYLKSNEFMAAQMTLVAGTLGQKGVLVSDEGGIGAWAKIDLPAPRKIHFDFKPIGNLQANGNCLWMQTSQP